MSKCPSQQYPECWFGCPEKATCLDLSPPPAVGDLGERILEQAEKLIKAYQDRVDRVVTDEVFEKVVRTFPNSILKIIKEAGLDISPPPVVRDLRAKIMAILFDFGARTQRGEIADCVEIADSILALLKKAGYVKLIPDPLKGTPVIKDIAKFVDSASEDFEE